MLDLTQLSVPERFRQHPLFTAMNCGVNFGFMAQRGYYSRPEVLEQPAKMRAAGVNCCTVNANLCQENYASRKVFLDFRFSSGEAELSEIIRRLHQEGIRVLLKPCLTPLDGAWMGAVNFPEGRQIQGVWIDYWQEWFASFTAASVFFAEFAEEHGVEGLIIGAEYFGTEGQSAHWREVIRAVREVYSGLITYEFTHLSRKAYDLDWFEALDFLSYSYYPPASPHQNPETFHASPHVGCEEMVQFLESRKAKIQSISQRFGNKPIAFTEAGMRSAHGCIGQPYNFLAETAYDGEEQANYMEALFRTFSTMPQWMGLYWWKWDETQHRPHYHTDPAGDKGFTIQGKPAEAVLKKWFGGAR